MYYEIFIFSYHKAEITTTDAALFNQIASLPPNLKDEVAKHILFLQFTQMQVKETTINGEVPKTKKTPKAGFSRAGFVMSPDFDAPLDDFKDYM